MLWLAFAGSLSPYRDGTWIGQDLARESNSDDFAVTTAARFATANFLSAIAAS